MSKLSVDKLSVRTSDGKGIMYLLPKPTKNVQKFQAKKPKYMRNTEVKNAFPKGETNPRNGFMPMDKSNDKPNDKSNKKYIPKNQKQI
jgi:hypothetical protein